MSEVELITAKELALKLGVHWNTTQRWAREGTIPTVKIGSTKYIHWPNFQKWMVENTSLGNK